MGRLKGSSTTSYRLIYNRLLKGPLWLDDWRSTGIRSRSTVNARLKHLLKLGLVQQVKDGHKRPYIINREKKMKDWLPLLVDKKEWEKIKAPSKDLQRWVLDLIKIISPRVKAVGRIGAITKESPENERVIDLILHSLDRGNFQEVLDLWHKYQTYEICRECLHNDKRIVATIEDPESNEIVCPNCGTVAPTPRFTTLVRKRS